MFDLEQSSQSSFFRQTLHQWAEMDNYAEVLGLCHAIFVYFQKLSGFFASVEFQK